MYKDTTTVEPNSRGTRRITSQRGSCEENKATGQRNVKNTSPSKGETDERVQVEMGWTFVNVV